ncbi:MAG: Wzz/FepE/Etk N-terminal domain-containing protein [Clostridia bacterium]|nr:Wzz/FepE/Etk N-terminal domain-containing protein [Clostridia bacterium]
MNNNQMIDVRDLVRIIFKRFWIIIVISAIFAGSSAVISKFLLDKVYESSATIYVVGKQSDSQNSIMYNDLMAGQQLVKDYRELIKQRLITEQVIDELNMHKELTPSSLASKISVSLKNETRILEIKVQDVNPERSAKLANKVTEVFSKRAVDIMRVENVKIIDQAVIPLNPVKPKVTMNIAIAFFIGLMLSIGLIFLLEFLDNTMKTPEDVQKHLGLPVIGNIPITSKE